MTNLEKYLNEEKLFSKITKTYNINISDDASVIESVNETITETNSIMENKNIYEERSVTSMNSNIRSYYSSTKSIFDSVIPTIIDTTYGYEIMKGNTIIEARYTTCYPDGKIENSFIETAYEDNMCIVTKKATKDVEIFSYKQKFGDEISLFQIYTLEKSKNGEYISIRNKLTPITNINVVVTKDSITVNKFNSDFLISKSELKMDKNYMNVITDMFNSDHNIEKIFKFIDGLSDRSNYNKHVIIKSIILGDGFILDIENNRLHHIETLEEICKVGNNKSITKIYNLTADEVNEIKELYRNNKQDKLII